MRIITMKCPGCGANLDIDEGQYQIRCQYCNQLVTVDYENPIVNNGKISIDGIETNSEIIKAGNDLIELNEYLKAKKKFLEFSEKCPDKYQGWWGLLVCRTRNFTIKDNNILFENDVRNYYQNFLKTAPNEIKEKYQIIVENYLHPVKQKAYTDTRQSKVNEIQFKGFSKQTKINLLIIFGILFMISHAASGCGFFMTMTGIFMLDGVSKNLKLTEKETKLFIRILGWTSVILLFVVDLPRLS